jgi:hypothetical protein
MPRYFIDIRIGSAVVHDTEGEDFDDLNGAKDAAPISARRLLMAALAIEHHPKRKLEIIECESKDTVLLSSA